MKSTKRVPAEPALLREIPRVDLTEYSLGNDMNPGSTYGDDGRGDGVEGGRHAPKTKKSSGGDNSEKGL